MKESLRKCYRNLGWNYAEYLMYRGQLRGNHKKSVSRLITHAGRRHNKMIMHELIIEQ